MKSVTILLCAALFTVSAASHAIQRGNCAEGQRGRCASLQPPPIAPVPPVPAVPPVPPAPPAPPPLPDVPDEAHAACKGKKIGARMTLSPSKGVTMGGTCQQDSKGMYFELHSLTED